MRIGFALILALSVNVPEPSIAEQSGPTLWDHNGSTVYLTANGQARGFYYQEPRSGMVAAGAKRGSLLFEGTSKKGNYQGIAYIYRGACGKFPYRVSGPVQDSFERVTLKGQAPRVAPDCRVHGYVADTLEFSLIKRNQDAKLSPQTNILSEFYGVWGEEPDCRSGMVITITKDEITLWQKFASLTSKDNEFYGACTIANYRKQSSTKVMADLIDCDHPGHKQSNVVFEKVPTSSIQTPFGLVSRCQQQDKVRPEFVAPSNN